MFFLAVALTSSALIIERMEGLLVVTQFVVMCGQTALFGVECKGDIGGSLSLLFFKGCVECVSVSLLNSFYIIKKILLVFIKICIQQKT